MIPACMGISYYCSNEIHHTKNKPIFKLFLKSRNLKYFTISPKSHSTDMRRALIKELKFRICGIALRKGY